MNSPGKKIEYSAQDIVPYELAKELKIEKYQISLEHDESVLQTMAEACKLVEDWPLVS